MNTDIEHLERLALDVDTRLLNLWNLAATWPKEWDLEGVGEFVRAAYVNGYYDALTEPVKGKLLRENGYRMPRRSK